VAGNIGFVGIMAFQACAKGFTAVAAVRMNQTRAPVLAQQLPLLLQRLQIPADGLFADGELFSQHIGSQPVALTQQGDKTLLSGRF